MKKLEKMVEKIREFVSIEDGIRIEYVSDNESTSGILKQESYSYIEWNGIFYPIIKAGQIEEYVKEGDDDKENKIFFYRNLKYAIGEYFDDGDIDEMDIYISENYRHDEAVEKEIMQNIYEKFSTEFEKDDDEKQFAKIFELKYPSEE